MNSTARAFAGLYVGQMAALTRVYDIRAVERWCALADMPELPTHVPEPLIAGLFSCLLGEQLPGHGTQYLKQQMEFMHPAPIGAPLEATVIITATRSDKALVDLATRCVDASGRMLCHGRALVLFDR